MASVANVGDGANLGLNDSIQAISSTASTAIASIQASANVSGILPSLPWTESKISSDFFQALTIDPSRWDELFPYRLMVIDATNNQVVFGPNGNLLPSDITLTYQPGTSIPIVSFLGPASPWVFQLPISPQQLSIQDQFSIKTSLTLRGVLEEHSGSRIKMINASGTFGVWPYRATISKPPSSPSILQSVFGGTIAAAGSVLTSINNAINIATNNHPANKPVTPRPTGQSQTSTGYYNALKLQQFLEQYAEAKKNPANATWRLVFDIPKQNQSFIVTPIIYNWKQSANKPMEIMFDFQLKAWRRIALKESPTQAQSNVQPLSPGILQRILGTIAEARQTLSAVDNLITAIGGDVSTVFNAFTQTALFVKDLSGVVTTATDLPNQIVQDFNSQIATYLYNNQTSIKSTITDPTTIKALNAIVALQATGEGLSLGAVTSGQLGTPAANNVLTSPALAPFSNPPAYYLLLDQVPLSGLTLTTAQQNTVSKLVYNASQTTIAQLKQYRQTILNLALALSNSFGTGSALYNQIYNLSPPAPSVQPITLNQYEILASLYEVLASYDILTATTQVDDDETGNALDYMAGLASTVNGLTFDVPTAKILVPVPYGLSIEQIASRYLGDPNRWLEIATLNALVEPFIDNDGFQYPLLSNAVGRQIVVASDDDLFIGQIIYLNSLTQTTVARTITAIEPLSSTTSFLITLDGLANLDTFLVQDRAYLQAYLPGTCNSMQKIYVPSLAPVPNTGNILPPPSTTGDPLTGLSGVDWLLTSSGDVAITGTG